MTKNILLPLPLGVKIYWLAAVLEDYDLPYDIQSACQEVCIFMQQKVEAHKKRATFAQYKTRARDDPQREQMRNAYLDQAEVRPKWRSTVEKSL